MSWWFDKDQKCSYEDWVNRAGGLMKFLDIVCQEYKFDLVLELGTGNSTRILSKRCKNVISIDINQDSIIVPVDEQKSFDKKYWSDFKKEDNVEFICADALVFDFSAFKDKEIDMILFDLGSTEQDKYLYRLCYERLKSEGIIKDNMILIADNSNMEDVVKFGKFLSEIEGYKIDNYPTGQFIARKVKNDSR